MAEGLCGSRARGSSRRLEVPLEGSLSKRIASLRARQGLNWVSSSGNTMELQRAARVVKFEAATSSGSPFSRLLISLLSADHISPLACIVHFCPYGDRWHSLSSCSPEEIGDPVRSVSSRTRGINHVRKYSLKVREIDKTTLPIIMG